MSQINNLQLDSWQKEFLATKGNKILNTGRQVGKSVVCSIDAGEYSCRNKNKVVLMIAPTERQAYELFLKALNYIEDNYPKLIGKGKDRPTKTRIILRNGTKIYCLPTGLTGSGIRGYTINKLYADEAARIPDEVWSAVTPMMLTSGEGKILLSTPAGKQGYFYDCWANKSGAFNDYQRFGATSEKVVKERKACKTWTEEQREYALSELKKEKAIMSSLVYGQEYEGKFLDELRQLFPTDLISKCMDMDKHTVFDAAEKRSLGADIARMGGDESAIVGLALDGRGNLWQIQQWNEQNTKLTYVSKVIQDYEKKFHYDKLFIDDGGLGAGVVDTLLQTDIKRKVRAINNATWAYDHDKSHKKIMKEHLYNNLLAMMEQGKVHLWKSNDLFQSISSIQAEWDGRRLKIWGKYSHLTEALVRAAWIVKEKGLNIYVA